MSALLKYTPRAYLILKKTSAATTARQAMGSKPITFELQELPGARWADLIQDIEEVASNWEITRNLVYGDGMQLFQVDLQGLENGQRGHEAEALLHVEFVVRSREVAVARVESHSDLLKVLALESLKVVESSYVIRELVVHEGGPILMVAVLLRDAEGVNVLVGGVLKVLLEVKAIWHAQL